MRIENDDQMKQIYILKRRAFLQGAGAGAGAAVLALLPSIGGRPEGEACIYPPGPNVPGGGQIRPGDGPVAQGTAVPGQEQGVPGRGESGTGDQPQGPNGPGGVSVNERDPIRLGDTLPDGTVRVIQEEWDRVNAENVQMAEQIKQLEAALVEANNRPTWDQYNGEKNRADAAEARAVTAENELGVIKQELNCKPGAVAPAAPASGGLATTPDAQGRYVNERGVPMIVGPHGPQPDYAAIEATETAKP